LVGKIYEQEFTNLIGFDGFGRVNQGNYFWWEFVVIFAVFL
jgi:hypothetical protein